MANIKGLQLLDERWKVASELHLLHKEPKLSSLQLRGLEGIFCWGLARGGIAEIDGRRSSGRMSICLHILGQATGKGEVCAVIDLHDSFDPVSAAAAEVRLEKIVWVRCKGNAEHALRAADLLLHAGGFGVVLLDLCEATARVLNRIPLSYWYRFRRAIENTPTILLVCAESPQARSCASNNIQVKSKIFHWSGQAPFLFLRGIEMQALQQKVAAIRPEPLLLKTIA